MLQDDKFRKIVLTKEKTLERYMDYLMKQYNTSSVEI